MRETVAIMYGFQANIECSNIKTSETQDHLCYCEKQIRGNLTYPLHYLSPQVTCTIITQRLWTGKVT